MGGRWGFGFQVGSELTQCGLDKGGGNVRATYKLSKRLIEDLIGSGIDRKDAFWKTKKKDIYLKFGTIVVQG